LSEFVLLSSQASCHTQRLREKFHIAEGCCLLASAADTLLYYQELEFLQPLLRGKKIRALTTHNIRAGQQQRASKALMIQVMSMNPQGNQPPLDYGYRERRYGDDRLVADIDTSINPSDVLCGRGKSSFTHGE